jgi:hypothetical protein
MLGRPGSGLVMRIRDRSASVGLSNEMVSGRSIKSVELTSTSKVLVLQIFLSVWQSVELWELVL